MIILHFFNSKLWCYAIYISYNQRLIILVDIIFITQLLIFLLLSSLLRLFLPVGFQFRPRLFR